KNINRFSRHSILFSLLIFVERELDLLRIHKKIQVERTKGAVKGMIPRLLRPAWRITENTILKEIQSNLFLFSAPNAIAHKIALYPINPALIDGVGSTNKSVTKAPITEAYKA